MVLNDERILWECGQNMPTKHACCSDIQKALEIFDPTPKMKKNSCPECSLVYVLGDIYVSVDVGKNVSQVKILNP